MSPFPTGTATAEPWPVLVVSRDGDHVAAVRRVLDGWPVPTTLSVVARAIPALRQALMKPERLVIVDWALDGPSGQALVRQLARLRPALPVLAFDALGVGGAADRMLAWPWSELTIVLDHWLLESTRHERNLPTERTS